MKPTIYESMFILHPGEATRDMDAAMETVSGLVTKAGGNVLDSRKWDDRRLAYEIMGQKRGIYVLVHFESQGSVPGELQRLAGMSELVLRMQTVIDADGVPQSQETPPKAAAADEPSKDANGPQPAEKAEADKPIPEAVVVETSEAEKKAEPPAATDEKEE